MLRLRYSKGLLSWLLVTPVLTVLILIIIYPLAYMIFISFHKWSIIGTLPRFFVGLGNFFVMFNDPIFWNSLRLTTTFVLFASLIELVLGLLIALLLNQELRGFRLIRTLFILPAVLAPVVVGLTWRWMLNADMGIVNYFLTQLSLPSVGWLGKPFPAFISIIMADVWQWTPFMGLIILAGLHSLPVEPVEAAFVDGASKWQLFRYITFPLLIPVIIVALLFRTMDAFKVFATVYMMTGGGPGRATDMFSFLIWRKGFFENQLGYAAALSIMLLVVMFPAMLGYIKILYLIRK